MMKLKRTSISISISLVVLVSLLVVPHCASAKGEFSRIGQPDTTTLALNGVGAIGSENVLPMRSGFSEATGGITPYGANGDNSTWYLAEGSTSWGFECWIGIENPNPSGVTIRATFMMRDGREHTSDYYLEAHSQGSLSPSEILGEVDFSTKIECLEGKPIAVDRTMSWYKDKELGLIEGHCSIGVTSPAKTWYLAEGSSAWGFECWILIQNPNATEATAQVTYMIEGAAPVTVQKKIPSHSRKTYNMANDIGAKDASIKVEADVPVIPERAMYRNNRREGHDSIGTTTPASSYYLAEGTTDWGFTTYVLIQNPNYSATDVRVTYMKEGGAIAEQEITIPANSRKTIRVNDVITPSDFSTRVSGSQPIIAERSMYWNNGTGEVCHDSIGLDAPHMAFYLPFGETGSWMGIETYTLVQNPNSCEVKVRVTYFGLMDSGIDDVSFSDTIPPNSRMTYSMADVIQEGLAAIMVRSLTSGGKIMVERSVYWQGKSGGTDTIGGYSD